MLNNQTSSLATPFAEQTDAPRVYSYARFSTPEQAQGNSLQRQTEAALKWTERKNLERQRDGLPSLLLDDKLRLHDLGVSAYRGANVAEGSELGSFLFACRQGLTPNGSYLLVESLDRVSRMTPRKVQRVLDDIVEAGVTVCTMNDGQEYDTTRLDSDPTALLIALMVSWRAHEESKVKAQRLSAAWQAKRQRVREGTDAKLTSKGPSWLVWVDGGWRERLPHADYVRRIFAMTLEGCGEHKIAATLNSEAVPVMGKGKMWHRSTISKVLRSRSVIGELVPGRMDHSSGRAVRHLEQPIPGAFPAVISRDDWQAVRALKDGKAPAVRGRGAKAPLSNLFAGLARCSDCGAAMTRVNKGAGPKGGRPKLICTSAKAGNAMHPYRSLDLETLHAAFQRHWQSLIADVPTGRGGADIDRERCDLLGTIDRAESELGELHVRHRHAPTGALAARIRGLDAAMGSYRADLGVLEQRSADADHGITATRVALLADLLNPPEGLAAWPADIGKINATLRTLLEGVTVDHRTGFLRFHWRQGGETSLMFAWIEH